MPRDEATFPPPEDAARRDGAGEAAPTVRRGGFAGPDEAALAALLTREGVVAPADMILARARAAATGRTLSRVLLERRAVAAGGLRGAGRSFAPSAPSGLVPRALRPGGRCLSLAAAGIALPLAGPDPIVRVALSRPEDWTRHRETLRAELGPCRPVHAPRAALEEAFAPLADRAVRAAETRCPPADSARTLRPGRIQLLGALGLAAVAVGIAPVTVLAIAVTLALAAGGALRAAGLVAALRRGPPEAPPGALPARLPRVTMIVPLLREDRIARRLVRRIEAVRWPRDALEVLLVHEAEDTVTADALARVRLPGWARPLAVPTGRLRTKPRALNYALAHATGDILGIWDAEDAPHPSQLEVVAARFAAAPPEVACLQGRLGFYNARATWLTRAFAVDYAAWFGLVLPGLARLGLPVPLGGTTLFFRREALEAVGAWDAHNVTEDADLGLRLHRRGWRTELVDTETLEEAVARPWSWVRQRSRWMKGYLMTWAVHVRRPGALRRDLGTLGVLAFHAHFLAGIAASALILPLWAALGWAAWVGHPVPVPVMVALGAVAVAASGVHYATQLVAAGRTGRRVRRLWVLCALLTLPLSALAAWKALIEIARAPFWWDKTSHG